MEIFKTTISKNNFQGQFCCKKLKPKQSKCLNEILLYKHNGVSCQTLLSDMPFDVDVVCLNPSKKAIHPRFNFCITHSRKQAAIQSFLTISSKSTSELNALKLAEFIKNFKSRLDSLKGDEKLTNKEELQRQMDFMLFGKYKSYFN